MLAFSQQQTNETITFDGNEREYVLYVPQSYSPAAPSPLLFAFHGGSGFANDFMNGEADFRSIADTAGFILVYPQALEDPNDGNSTNWMHKEPTDHNDVNFIDALIDALSTNYAVDMQRIYACGYSLGGIFSFELACHLNNKIAAIASVAGAAFVGAFDACNLTHPTAILSVVGTEDFIHPYNDINGWYYPVSEINQFWANHNQTDSLAVVVPLENLSSSDGSTVERHSWQNGDACVRVEELKIIGGGHDWPSPLASWGNQDIDATSEVWQFVSQFSMNGLIGCDAAGLLDFHSDQSKKLYKIVNSLGQQVTPMANQLLFYLYQDGTVEKKRIIE